MHLLFVVSDTLTGCNLCWTVSCPTWWYAELSEHRSNIQSTSACSCSLHHRHEPAEVYSHYYTSYWSSHTEQKSRSVFRLWQVEWVSSPHPCVLQGPEIFIVFQGFIKLFDRRISWLWGLRVSCDFVFVCKICKLTADRWRNVVAKVTLWALMSQIWGVSV